MTPKPTFREEAEFQQALSSVFAPDRHAPINLKPIGYKFKLVRKKNKRKAKERVKGVKVYRK